MNPLKISFLERIQKEVFDRHNLPIIPIKVYHDDLDLDMVLVNPKDFKKTKRYLIKEGFKHKRTISSLREPDKRLYQKQGDAFKIHLHKYISWNGSIYLDSKKVWERSKIKSGIRVLSGEDEFLIMAAHNIFENIYLPKEDKIMYDKLKNRKLDKTYIKTIAKKYNWEAGLKLFIHFADSNIELFPFFPVFVVYMKKLFLDIFKFRLRYIPREIFTFFLVNYFWCYRNAKKGFKIPISAKK